MYKDFKKEIILKAWNVINEDTKIKKIYFFHGLISILFLSLLLVYQVIYTYVELFNKKEEALVVILNFFHSSYFIETLIAFGVFILVYIIISPMFEWALVHYLHKKNTNTEASFTQAFGAGLYRFLPLFEYNNIFNQFRFISIINIYLFCLRFIGVAYIYYLSAAFLFLLWIATIINILFSYARFEIILNNKKALASISSSVRIALFNLWTTIRIYFFLFLVNIRVIINFIVFLLFPILIALIVTYISSKIFLIITLGMVIFTFICLIILLWYLWGVLDIFKTAIWYFAYQEWLKNLDDHEEISEEDDN